MSAPKAKVWFGLAEAAEHVGLSPRQLTRLVQARKITFYRPSGTPTGPLQFHREDLDEYMANCRVEAKR